MAKIKVVLKGLSVDDSGFGFESRHKGDEGLCMSMAIGFATSIAKQNGISLTKLKSLVADMYNEEGEINDGKN